MVKKQYNIELLENCISENGVENFRKIMDNQENQDFNNSLKETNEGKIIPANIDKNYLKRKKRKKEYNSLFIFGPRNKFRLMVVAIIESKYLFICYF